MIITQIRTLTMLFVVLTGCILLLTGCGNEPDIPESGKFIDSRDQKEYRSVKIGTQTWMAENLAYLPAVSPPQPGSDTAKYYYVFKFIESSSVLAAKQWEYFSPYGVFYNWPAAMDGADSSNVIPSGVKGVCPEGWHLPSDGEWDILVQHLGGDHAAGKEMKSTKGWNIYFGESGNGTNSSGFNAIPAGGRHNDGGFYNYGNYALFWSSTSFDRVSAWYRNPVYTQIGVYHFYINKGFGFSVRCVRDD